mgnify:CR=1 FL=1
MVILRRHEPVVTLELRVNRARVNPLAYVPQ